MRRQSSCHGSERKSVVMWWLLADLWGCSAMKTKLGFAPALHCFIRATGGLCCAIRTFASRAGAAQVVLPLGELR